VIRLIFAFTLLAAPALAQQAPPDPATLQRAITAIQQQRNSALDQAASMQIEAQRLADENAKLKAEIEELKKAK
jgi:hypothetical protein